MLKLFDHQEKARKVAVTKPNLILLWSMGTGKTGCIISILRDRYNENKKVLRTLIFAPPSCVYNWAHEFSLFSNIPNDYILVSTGSGAKRARLLNEALMDKVTNKLANNKIIIINLEALRSKAIAALLLKWAPEITVVDEAHQLKNPKSIQSKAVYTIAKHSKHRYMLTGTLILNTPLDAFMPFKILDPSIFGTNFFVYRSLYMVDLNSRWSGGTNYFPNYQPNPAKLDELHDKIYSIALRVRKEECLDLPPRIEQTVYVEMSSVQKKAYNSMKRDYICYVDNLKKGGKPLAVVASLSLVKVLKLQQIVTGFVTSEDGTNVVLADVPRLKELKNLVQQIVPTDKLIIWAAYIQNYRMIAEMLDDLGIKYTKIIGGLSASEKQDSITSFNEDPSVRVVIANQKAGGIGINLTSASYSIVYSRGFSLAEHLQSEARNYRSGSNVHDKIVAITLCCKGTIDEIVHSALSAKEDLAKKIIDPKVMKEL